MKAVWTGLGVLMGTSVGIECGGFIGAIVLMLACLAEFATLGAIFALIGGRPKDTIFGAIGGLLGGLVVGMMEGQASVVLLANVGMLVGALVGVLLHACLHVLGLLSLALGRLLHLHRRAAVNAMVELGSPITIDLP